MSKSQRESIGESDLDRAYQVGVSAGLNMAAVKLDTESKEYFSLHRDELAKELRGWAREFRDWSKAKHPDNKGKEPKP